MWYNSVCNWGGNLYGPYGSILLQFLKRSLTIEQASGIVERAAEGCLLLSPLVTWSFHSYVAFGWTAFGDGPATGRDVGYPESGIRHLNASRGFGQSQMCYAQCFSRRSNPLASTAGCELSILKLFPSLLGRDMDKKLKGLILAQNERWRRGLGMQVERERVNLATRDPY